MQKTAVIYYFTGTGNAFRLANQSANELRTAGYTVIVADIAGKNRNVKAVIPPEHANAELIGIISAVYGFGLPQLTAKFLRNMPKSKLGKKCFVFIASAGNEGVCVLQAAIHLKLKGYKLIFARTFTLVSNWIMFETLPDKETQDKIFAQSDTLMKEYMKSLIEGGKSVVYSRSNILLVAVFAVVYPLFVFFGRQFLGKMFTVNNKCNACKYCYNHCPSKTIKWLGHRPYWGWNCQQCFRCINLCPTGAIEVSVIAILALIIGAVAGPIIFLKFVPNELLDYTGVLKPFLENIAVLHLIFAIIAMWLMQILLANKVIAKLFPSWYVTKNKPRYKEPHFRP
ncbi:MAG: hypothetical protein A2252_04605 [Elusimicrobia bacterium RIFOXYA2_FULL_39_19]|nr:MAG: hypothetical protein A2252_04605 [Elusimicrobia bacterium RIFOXYA2_FULL_39_19]